MTFGHCHYHTRPPADERDSHQLSVALVGALVDPDNAHLPGPCAGPDGEFGGGALKPFQSMCLNTPEFPPKLMSYIGVQMTSEMIWNEAIYTVLKEHIGRRDVFGGHL